VLSPLHSHGKNRKQRIREALLVFHPNRFDKWIRLVRNERGRQLVRDAAGSVVRILKCFVRSRGRGCDCPVSRVETEQFSYPHEVRSRPAYGGPYTTRVAL
jgi:hypothetical protein